MPKQEDLEFEMIHGEPILWVSERYPDMWCSKCLVWYRFVYEGKNGGRYCTHCKEPVAVIKNSVLLGATPLARSVVKDEGNS